MDRSTKEDWTAPGAGDLITGTVEDVPVPGKSVLVRSLPASFSLAAAEEAMEISIDESGEQSITLNAEKLAHIKFAKGVQEPEFTVEEAAEIAGKFGAAFFRVISEIDRISELADEEAIERVQRRFPDGEDGGDDGDSGEVSAGGGEPEVHGGAGASDG